ncbi:hypothetical protein D3C81_1334500 [compost metagenome]
MSDIERLWNGCDGGLRQVQSFQFRQLLHIGRPLRQARRFDPEFFQAFEGRQIQASGMAPTVEKIKMKFLKGGQRPQFCR